MGDEYDSSESAAQAAAKKGLVVVYPNVNELFVDIDDEGHALLFKSMLQTARNQVASHTFRPSQSGSPGRYHGVVVLHAGCLPRDEGERIAMQALFGSDPLRERLSYARWLKGDKRPTRFFELPAVAVQYSPRVG